MLFAPMMLKYALISRFTVSATQAKSFASKCARCSSLVLLTGWPSVAQQHTLDVSQYLHTSWTTQEGFFKGGITSITQSADGYLWLLSNNGGIYRFDGVRFYEWKPRSEEALPHQPFNRLLGARDGSLWIGSNSGIAERKPNGDVRRYSQLDGAFIVALIEDKGDAIWAGGTADKHNSILCRFYHGGSECIPANDFLGSRIYALHEDAKGQVWVIASSGIWRLRPGPPRKFASLPIDTSELQTFDDDANGTLIFDAGRGLRMISPDGNVAPYSIEPLSHTNVLLKDRQGNLWIGYSGKGIVHLHADEIDSFATSDGLTSNAILAFFEDHEGNVWAGTARGLDKFTKPAVAIITNKQGLSNDFVNSVAISRAGTPWIGTADGLYKLENDRAIESNAKLPNKVVLSMLETSRRRMIVGTADPPNSLIWLDGNTVEPLPAVTGEDVFGLAEGSHAELWAASREEGLLHLRGDGRVIDKYGTKSIGPIKALAFDPKRDGVWLTTHLGQLKFFKDGRVGDQYDSHDGLGEGLLRDPQVDSDGGVWIGAQVGLARLKGGKISIMGRKNGLPCDVVHWMRSDKYHNVWLYTECGLVSFSEHDLAAWVADPSHAVAIIHQLDNTDGVEINRFNGWYTPRTATMQDGRILFATNIGLSILDPGNLNQNSSPPPVHIEEISADERDIQNTGSISLPIKVHNVRIAFTALSFANPRKVLFRYKLQPFDKDWSTPTSLRQATYTNLAPGNYEFRVIACNNAGVWNMTGDTVNLSVPPALYQRLWFQCLMVIAFACLLWLAYARRLSRITAEIKARLGERLQERERIARELHDSLLQDLQAVILRFQLVANRLTTGDPNRVAIENGLDYADKVLADGRNQIRDIRSDTHAMDELSKSLTAYGEELADLWPETFNLSVTGKQFEIDANLRDELYRIGREAIGNAFRHSRGSSVDVEMAYLATGFLMRVSDDGEGIDPDIVAAGRKGHWGIANMQERAQKIGASLKISRLPQGGSLVELTIPLELAQGRHMSWSFWRPKNGPK